MARNDLTAERLRELLHYDPETGAFTSKRFKGARVLGSKSGNGYTNIRLGGHNYKAHRLAFLYMTGEWPELVDHIDCDKRNNKWDNLREVDEQANRENRKPHMGVGTSNKLGVSVVEGGKRFMARISTKGKQIYLGYFKTEDEASQAYMAAKIRLHPGYIP